MNDELASKTFSDLYSITRGMSDREISIIGSSYIDNILSNLIKLRIVKNSINIKDEDSFSYKIKLCRSIGILNKRTYDSLISLSKIRNNFAHDYTKNNFNDEDFLNHVNSIINNNKDIIDAIKEITVSEEYEFDKNEVADFMQQTSNKLRLVISTLAGGLMGGAESIERIEERV